MIKIKRYLDSVSLLIFLETITSIINIDVASADTIVTSTPDSASRQELQSAVSSIMANIQSLQNSFTLNQAQTQASLSSIEAQIHSLKTQISNDTNRITTLEQLQKGK